MVKKKLLILCMGDSPHAARWINNISKDVYEVHIFPCTIYGVVTGISDVIIHSTFASIPGKSMFKLLFSSKSNLRNELQKIYQERYQSCAYYDFLIPIPVTISFERIISRIKSKIGNSKVNTEWLYGPFFIKFLIKKIKPDLIHTMEFQHNAYRLYEAKKSQSKKFPKWLATNWGSDIYFYRHDKAHLKDIQNVLNSIDFYSCECHRDIRIAKELGMKCRVMPVTVNSGGFELETVYEKRIKEKPTDRNIILVKGYQHFAGRAITALKALTLVGDILNNFKIVIFSASESTIQESKNLAKQHMLPECEIISHTSHEDILDLHAKARIYVGISKSDAVSTSVLESIALGGFPIQSSTSCCDEWITDGKTGFIVPYDNVETIAEKIRRALTDDELVEDAYLKNWQTVMSRLDSSIIRDKVNKIYDECLSG